MRDKRTFITSDMLRAAQEKAAVSAAESEKTEPGHGDQNAGGLTPTSQPSTTSADPAAVDGATPAKRRRVGRRLILVLSIIVVVAFLGWIGIEQLGGNSGSHSAPTSGAASRPVGDASMPAANQKSVTTAVEYETKTNAGPVREGCALAVDPPACEQSLIGGPIGSFSVSPKVLDTAVLDAQNPSRSGDVNPAPGASQRTVVLISFTLVGDTEQKWAVLVRDSDHKVIGDKAIGARDSGKSLTEIGQEIQGANS